MTVTPAQTAVPGPVRGRRIRRRTLVALAAPVAAAVGVLVLIDPFSGGTSRAGVTDNDYPTSLATVSRRTLTSQTQVSGTLGYAGSKTVVVPAGTAQAAVLQAEQAVSSARGQLENAQAAKASDERMLEEARSALSTDRNKQARDCRTTPPAGPCAADRQAVSRDEQSVSSAEDKVAADGRSVAAAESGLTAAETSLSSARVSETAYDTGSSYTMLPAVGSIVRRGQALYAMNGQPVLLLYGRVTAWRAFRYGMSAGRDVAGLNASLRALGYGKSLSGNEFTSATADAIRAFQKAHRLAETGELLLGSLVFEAGPVRVTSVTPTLGAAVQPGPVLGVTSTSRQVVIALDAAQQAEIKVGDHVTITLPDSSTTPGVVSSVGSVATTPSNDGTNGGGNDSPTVEVDVTPSDPAATGRLDQAPVQVSIVTASAPNALVVPVNALLALAGGGYAVETVDGKDVHHLVPVELGLFDNSEGLVEVTDTSLVPGQRVVVPSS